MADDLNEAARCASRAGNHALAERLFRKSAEEHGNAHSAANVIYERYLQGECTAEEVGRAVQENNIQDTGHGQWLVNQVRR